MSKHILIAGGAGPFGKIGRVFGFRPRRSFEAGMAELIDWIAIAKAPVNRSQESWRSSR